MGERNKGVSFSEADLKKKLADGKIKGFKIMNDKKLSQVVPARKEEAPEKIWIRNNIAFLADVFRYRVVEEMKFHETRKWRFDFAVPELMLAIEYEGIISEKSRHTTITGYTGDSEKYNEAQRLGWMVLRYTVLNYKSVVNDISNILRDRIISK